MIGKLIPLLVAGGISVHSSDTLKDRFQQALGMSGSYVTKQRMGTVLRTARLDVASGEDWNVRTDQQLTKWIRNNIRIEQSDDVDPSLDTWGTALRQKYDRGTLTILSAGPDKNFGTQDDLKARSNIYNY